MRRESLRPQMISQQIDEGTNFCRSMAAFAMQDVYGYWGCLELIQHGLQPACGHHRRHLIGHQPRNTKTTCCGLDGSVVA